MELELVRIAHETLHRAKLFPGTMKGGGGGVGVGVVVVVEVVVVAVVVV